MANGRNLRPDGTIQTSLSYYLSMQFIGLPELIVAAAALVLAFFGWLIFRPSNQNSRN
jgi:hypothetical protein